MTWPSESPAASSPRSLVRHFRRAGVHHLAAPAAAGGNVVRLSDRELGLAASTIKRRLTSVSGLYSYLTARGLVAANPGPRGLATRRADGRGVPRPPAAPGAPADCPGCCYRVRSTTWSARCAPTKIGRWSRRGCAARLLGPASSGSGSCAAIEGGSGSSRLPGPSSPCWAARSQDHEHVSQVRPYVRPFFGRPSGACLEADARPRAKGRYCDRRLLLARQDQDLSTVTAEECCPSMSDFDSSGTREQ